MHKPIDNDLTPPTKATTEEGCSCPCKAPASEVQGETPEVELGTVLLAVHYDIGKNSTAK